MNSAPIGAPPSRTTTLRCSFCNPFRERVKCTPSLHSPRVMTVAWYDIPTLNASRPSRFDLANVKVEFLDVAPGGEVGTGLPVTGEIDHHGKCLPADPRDSSGDKSRRGIQRAVVESCGERRSAAAGS